MLDYGGIVLVIYTASLGWESMTRFLEGDNTQFKITHLPYLRRYELGLLSTPHPVI